MSKKKTTAAAPTTTKSKKADPSAPVAPRSRTKGRKPAANMLEPVPVASAPDTQSIEATAAPAAVPAGDEARAENAPVAESAAPASAGVDAPAAETAAAETTRPEVSGPVPTSTVLASIPAKKMSALDAAAHVLAEAGRPMNCQELIAAMAAQGLWTSPGGRTPAATLYASMTKEIVTKRAASRFQKTGRGQFAANTERSAS